MAALEIASGNSSADPFLKKIARKKGKILAFRNLILTKRGSLNLDLNLDLRIGPWCFTLVARVLLYCIYTACMLPDAQNSIIQQHTLYDIQQQTTDCRPGTSRGHAYARCVCQ